MDIIEIKNIKPYTSVFKYLSRGTTAKCYKLDDRRVIKVYSNTARKKQLFEKNDMFELLEYIGEIANDSYIGTQDIYLCHNDIVAYSMPYAKGKNLMDMDRSTPIPVLIEQLKKLRYDTYKITECEYRIEDMHDRNILYSKEEGFKVIDLDGGKRYQTFGNRLFEMHNLKVLKETIIKGLLKVPYHCDIVFDDDELEHLYHSMDDNIEKLIREMTRYVKNPDPTIADLKRNRIKMISLKNKESEE